MAHEHKHKPCMVKKAERAPKVGHPHFFGMHKASEDINRLFIPCFGWSFGTLSTNGIHVPIGGHTSGSGNFTARWAFLATVCSLL